MHSATPPTHGVDLERSFRDSPAYRLRFVLVASLLSLFGHALLPIEQFIYRADDAYYYFKVAQSFPELGFWTFDGVHPTTGVQPLWALLLTALAQLYAWTGGVDPDVFARIAVAVTGLLHFASCVVLFHLLARRISTVTALAAAGALLFPLGLVWSRVWGMENSLFALLLLSTTAYYDLHFSLKRTLGRSAVLGLLLGLTGLARLNAFLLVPCLLLHFLGTAREESVRRRLKLAGMVGSVATLLLLSYVLPMQLATGRPMPVSGAVKAIQTTRFLAQQDIDSRFSWKFFETIAANSYRQVGWFVTSRVTDGTWIAGGRILFHGDSSVPPRGLLSAQTRSGQGPQKDPALLLFPGLLLVVSLAPALVGGLRAWQLFLSSRLQRLWRFHYLLGFAVLDTAVSILLYPTQLNNAIVQWWSVCQETILVVTTATVVVAGLSFVARRLFTPAIQRRLLTATLAGLVTFHAWDYLATFWRGEVFQYDWKLSWNDESYRAAMWLAQNVPEEAIVGSWNAGVLGFYAKQRVINLDGLINSDELLAYLREGTLGKYIRKEGIEYLSDMGNMPATIEDENLVLTPVYSHYSPLMNQEYRIYRVSWSE